MSILYKWKCPYCGYKSVSRRYLEMRQCPKKPWLVSLFGGDRCSVVPND